MHTSALPGKFSTKRTANATQSLPDLKQSKKYAFFSCFLRLINDNHSLFFHSSIHSRKFLTDKKDLSLNTITSCIIFHKIFFQHTIKMDILTINLSSKKI